MKKILIIVTLSITVAAVIKRVGTKHNKQNGSHNIKINGKSIDELISDYSSLRSFS